MARYTTSTDPKLVLEHTVTPAQTQRVTLTGDRVKVLYEGTDDVEARAVYDYAREHYEQRRIAGVIDGVKRAANQPCDVADCPITERTREPHPSHEETFVVYVAKERRGDAVPRTPR